MVRNPVGNRVKELPLTFLLFILSGTFNVKVKKSLVNIMFVPFVRKRGGH